MNHPGPDYAENPPARGSISARPRPVRQTLPTDADGKINNKLYFQTGPDVHPVDPAKVLKPRLAVVETVYHQSIGESPTSIEIRFSRYLEDKEEQPCIRKWKATEKWEPLNAGWIRDTSMITITNEEGRLRFTIPSAAEVQDTSERVIEVGVATVIDDGREVVTPVFLIHPGENARIQPISIPSLRVRSRAKEAKYTLAAFPI